MEAEEVEVVNLILLYYLYDRTNYWNDWCFVLPTRSCVVALFLGSARWRWFGSYHEREKVAEDCRSFVLSGVKEHRKYLACALWKESLSIWCVHGWSSRRWQGRTEKIGVHSIRIAFMTSDLSLMWFAHYDVISVSMLWISGVVCNSNSNHIHIVL